MKILLTGGLVAAVLVTAVAVVVAQHEARRVFVEIQDLEATRDDLNEEWGRLQLEQSTWATNDRIEDMARKALEMEEPSGSALVLLRH